MQESEKSAMRYIQKISANPEMSNNKLLKRIKKGSSILEFGPASGAMTQVMNKELDCRVSIVEIDKECYKNVMQYAVDGVCSDIELYNWEEAFAGQTFDYIIFSDVLEHLKNPQGVLEEVQKFLKPDGSVLISVPNIAHNSIIIQLLKNQFIYQSTGILDYTHIRHFTYSELVNMCTNAGYGIIYMDAVYIGVGKNEFDLSYGDIDLWVAEALKKRPFGEVYQHILEIKKKEYVEKYQVKIENCLGMPKQFTSIDFENVEKKVSSSETVNKQIVELLSERPNYYFESNDEIARMRLEINELYDAYPYLSDVVALKRRIYNYQEEVREKNRRINLLLSEIEKNDANLQHTTLELKKENVDIHQTIYELEKNNRDLQQTICNLEKNNRDLQQTIYNLEKNNRDLQQTIYNLEKNNADLQQIIRNKEGHIELLLEVERAYEREKQTRSYKIAAWSRKVVGHIIPSGSKREFFLYLLFQCIKHPILMLRTITPTRIKDYFIVSRKEGMDSVWHYYRQIEGFEKSRLNGKPEVNVVNVDSKEKAIEDYEVLEFTQWEQPLVSIIIPVYNQFAYTYRCLESILKNSSDIKYEVIIGNDCSTDQTKELDKVVHGINIITNKENLRFLRNCNNASKQAKGKYILFLNNDTQVQENWLSSLLNIIENDVTVGMVGSKLIYPDGYLQEAGGIVWNDGSAWNFGQKKLPDAAEYNYVKDVDYISGAAIMIRKSLWEEIGGFDDRFAPAYYEDTDLAFEVRKHGYRVVYQPLSVVIHFEGISNGTDVKQGIKAYQVENQNKFYEKWKEVLEKEHYPNAENVFLAKDRSRLKKRILVVDHYVPNYDKDAGGKCTYMYLKTFIKLGMKVAFIGDNFAKMEPYATELNQLGIEILYGSFYYNNWQEWLKNNLKYFDYVYLQRPHISIKYMDIVKEYSHAKVFYFAHDLHHLREYRQYQLDHNPETLKSSEHWKKIEYELFEKADVGHVVGSYEQEIMQKAFPDKPIRNIPLYIYEDELNDIQKDFSKREDIMYVGGFGHPPNEDAVLWFAREVFPKVLEKYPTMKWHVVGSKVPKVIQELASDNILIEGFQPDEELHRLYRECRMAVVPLRYGAGVKGKVVESAYFQIPLVTTSIGAEGLNCEDHPFIVEDDAGKMAEIICNLYESFDELKELSDKGKVFIQKNFTLEVAENVLKADMDL